MSVAHEWSFFSATLSLTPLTTSLQLLLTFSPEGHFVQDVEAARETERKGQNVAVYFALLTHIPSPECFSWQVVANFISGCLRTCKSDLYSPASREIFNITTRFSCRFYLRNLGDIIFGFCFI